MIVSVKVPARVFSQAANVLKTNEYYVLHVAREEMFSEIDDIRHFSMATGLSFPIIRVMNDEDETKWFLSKCESVQGSAMTLSWDILLTGIVEVTNQATLDLLNVMPYRHDNGRWNMIEERAREAFSTHNHPHRDSVDSLVDAVRVWYNDPVYQSFLSSLRPQSLDSTRFVPSDYVTSGAPIINVEDEPRFEEPKDTKPQMSISEMLFGGD